MLPPVLTVTQLTQRVRSTLESQLDTCWVAGELTNFKRAASGHCYFTLKDPQSQIAAVMFRSVADSIRFRADDGLEVIVSGRVGLYPARGTLQFYVDAMEPRGVGAAQLALEQLKKRLAAEGLFDDSRKRPLPPLPQAIGIVTALTGAAVHDMLVTIRQRWPSMRIVVRPVRVQGQDAPPEIVAALDDLNRCEGVDVVIVGRGGGSLEDLWAFNDERVARAIAASRVPVVSAVGHEIDVTVADLVADRRAPTPTAAAAIVVPDGRELAQWADQMAGALRSAIARRLARQREWLDARARRLRDPKQGLLNLEARVVDLEGRAARAAALRLRLGREQLRTATERLHALSPLAVLDRGYAIARRLADGTVVRDAARLTAGDRLGLTFARGTAMVTVDASQTTPGASPMEPIR